MLLSLLAALLHLSSAAPTEPSVLSIPVRDIVRNDLSAHESHPNFELYTRWLETQLGSYVRRDPGAAFTKHSNIISINCYSNTGDCFLSSQMAFSELANSPKELRALTTTLEEQLEARNDQNSEALLTRDLEKRLDIGNVLSTNHLKTYHNFGPQEPVAGIQHYIVWNLKCKTVQFESMGFQLTGHTFFDATPNSNRVGQLTATHLGDTDPATTHSVMISISFSGAIFGSTKCWTSNFYTKNYIGGQEVLPPKTEPLECVSAKDVSKFNCDTAHVGGWCTVHITQRQRNQGDGLHLESYRFDVRLFDKDKEIVGDLELVSIPSGEIKQLPSNLPYTFGVGAPNLDNDAVYMYYNGQKWGSNDQDHKCNFGKYDSGKREGDCGFSC